MLSFLDEQFADTEVRTRGIVIYQNGEILAERFANDIETGEVFTADTPLLAWSMAKSITSTLVGERVQDGAMDLEESIHAPEWQLAENDPRCNFLVPVALCDFRLVILLYPWLLPS